MVGCPSSIVKAILTRAKAPGQKIGWFDQKMGSGGRPKTATFKFYVVLAGGLMRRPVRRRRPRGHPMNAHRIFTAETRRRGEMSNETFGFSPRLRVSAVILLT